MYGSNEGVVQIRLIMCKPASIKNAKLIYATIIC